MKVLIVGDSQAAGAPGREFEAKLRAQGIQTARLGHVGHGAYDWTQMHWPEYRAALTSFQPDQVVLIFGSNDPAGSRLAEAFAAFKQSAPAVFYAGPPWYADSSLRATSAAIRDLARQVFGPRHLDAWPHTGPGVSRTADRVHFAASGARVWAEGMWRGWQERVSGVAPIVWVGPVVFGAAAVALFGFWWWSRR